MHCQSKEMENKEKEKKPKLSIIIEENIKVDIYCEDKNKKIEEILEKLRIYLNSDIVIENI